MNYYMTAIHKYSKFSGRSTRSEYWWFTLFYTVGYALCFAIDMAIFGRNTQVLSTIFSLAHLAPSFAVAVRRLHDIDRSGWWFLIIFTGIGAIVLFVWYCLRGTPGPNRFGDPTSDRLVTSQA